MKKLILFTTCFMLMSSVCFADVQLWNLNNVEADFTDDLGFEADQEFRFSDGVSSLTYESTEFRVDYKLVDYLSMGIGYRQVFAGDGDTFTAESRPNINVGVKAALFDDVLAIRDRLRVEFRFVGDDDMAFRCRNLLTLGVEVLKNVNLLLSDELFLTDAGLEENRLGVGIDVEANETVNVGAGYQLQTTGLAGDESENGHAVTVNLGLSF